jgi:hypothetical protein
MSVPIHYEYNRIVAEQARKDWTEAAYVGIGFCAIMMVAAPAYAAWHGPAVSPWGIAAAGVCGIVLIALVWAGGKFLDFIWDITSRPEDCPHQDAEGQAEAAAIRHREG